MRKSGRGKDIVITPKKFTGGTVAPGELRRYLHAKKFALHHAYADDWKAVCDYVTGDGRYGDSRYY